MNERGVRSLKYLVRTYIASSDFSGGKRIMWHPTASDEDEHELRVNVARNYIELQK